MQPRRVIGSHSRSGSGSRGRASIDPSIAVLPPAGPSTPVPPLADLSVPVLPPACPSTPVPPPAGPSTLVQPPVVPGPPPPTGS